MSDPDSVRRRFEASGSGAAAGRVYLVGAGPGDPGLMTARSLELISSADAILFDRLIPDGALAGAPAGADLRYVGKEPGHDPMAQDGINRLLVELARAGKRVVRLKGGDPFVFGRGGEEAEALREAGIEFEVVPGITAGIAAPAYAGIPVTHRGAAAAVAFVTGHEDPAQPESRLDWVALARFPGTLVVYMGVGGLASATERLIAEGRPADEPAAIVERGTTGRQRTLTATLGTLADAAAQAGVRSPAITLFGEVAALRERIGWLERRPLHGRTVVVTRARAQASGLAAQLRDLGADVVEAPAIRIDPRPVAGDLTATLDSIGRFALVCVTSPAGADLLMDGLEARELDARALAGVTVAAIGPATAHALRARGIAPDVVPATAVTEALAAALASVDVAGRRVLVVRPEEARDVLADVLRERGAHVEQAVLYETVPEPIGPATLDRVATADYVTFTAGSTVRNLLGALGADGLSAGPRVISIGPVTSAAARAAGIEVHVEAERHDTDGLVAALLEDARTRPPST